MSNLEMPTLQQKVGSPARGTRPRKMDESNYGRLSAAARCHQDEKRTVLILSPGTDVVRVCADDAGCKPDYTARSAGVGQPQLDIR
jgi:hypothetical protein